MRVLAVGNMYPPHHLGGYELVWRSAMAHVRAQGHEVRVLTTDFSTGAPAPDDAGTYRELRWYWRDHAWPSISWPARVELERHNQAVLERHLAELRPDVVSWWAMGGMSLSLLERVRRRGPPAVAFVHDDWLSYGPRVDRWTRSFARHPRVAALAERATGVPARVQLEHAARYVFVSETTRERARATGLELVDSDIAHSGIDPSFLDPRPVAPWTWKLLYVGRVDERKGIGDAIAALERLPPEATLTIAGSGEAELEKRLTDLAVKLGVADRVQWLGMRSRPDLPGIYEAADVVLFPVRWEEPWGLVPLEAMALGRPVVATGRGGSGEYLRDGENAVIVPAQDPAALAGAVDRLASDPELVERLRAGGVDTAATHTETIFNAAALEALTVASSHR